MIIICPDLPKSPELVAHAVNQFLWESNNPRYEILSHGAVAAVLCEKGHTLRQEISPDVSQNDFLFAVAQAIKWSELLSYYLRTRGVVLVYQWPHHVQVLHTLRALLGDHHVEVVKIKTGEWWLQLGEILSIPFARVTTKFVPPHALRGTTRHIGTG